MRFEVWAPASRRCRARGRRRPAADARRRRRMVVPPRSPTPGTARTTAFASTAATPPDPRVAVAARTASTARPRRRPRPLRLDRPTAWRGMPLAGLGHLRAARRHVHARGHVRGVIARLADLRRPGGHRHRADARGAVPGRRGTGATTASPCSPPPAAYGGPDELRGWSTPRHARGLAVFLDVVYNHLGPEGNYLREFGPYFTDRYQTAWGDALNFDGRGRDAVRAVLLDNALHVAARGTTSTGCAWTPSHAIYDDGARHFLDELAERVRGARPARPAAAADRRERSQRPALIRPRATAGCGLDGAWADDFHHALHALPDRRPRGLLRATSPARPTSAKSLDAGRVLHGGSTRATAAATGHRRDRLRPRPVRRLPPEPRSGREPRARRSAAPLRRPRPAARSRAAPAAAVAVHAAAVHGRGVGGRRRRSGTSPTSDAELGGA